MICLEISSFNETYSEILSSKEVINFLKNEGKKYLNKVMQKPIIVSDFIETKEVTAIMFMNEDYVSYFYINKNDTAYVFTKEEDYE